MIIIMKYDEDMIEMLREMRDLKYKIISLADLMKKLLILMIIQLLIFIQRCFLNKIYQQMWK